MLDVLRELFNFNIVNEETNYGFHGYILFGLIRFGLMTKVEGCISAIEIYVGLTMLITLKVRLEKTNMEKLRDEIQQ